MSSRTYLHDNRWLTEVTVDANSTHSREATKDEIAEAENAPPAPPAADKSKPRTYQHDGKWLTEVTVDKTTSHSRDATADEIVAAVESPVDDEIPTDTKTPSEPVPTDNPNTVGIKIDDIEKLHEDAVDTGAVSGANVDAPNAPKSGKKK